MKYLIIFLFCISLIPQLGVTTTLCIHDGKVKREQIHFSHSDDHHFHQAEANCEYHQDHAPVSECNHFDVSIIVPNAKVISHNYALLQQLPFCFYLENSPYRGPPSRFVPLATEHLPPLQGLTTARTAVIIC